MKAVWTKSYQDIYGANLVSSLILSTIFISALIHLSSLIVGPCTTISHNIQHRVRNDQNPFI
jgi:hypothetical protein